MPPKVEQFTPANLAFTAEELLTGTDLPADSSTPSQVAGPTPPASFDIPVQNTISSQDLAEPATLDDLRAERARLEQQQETANFDQFESDLPEPTVFSDPNSFLISELYGDREPTQVEQDIARQRRGVTRTVSGIDEALTDTREQAEETQQLTEREAALAETNNKIAQRQTRFRREMRAFEQDAEKRGFARGFVQAERQKMEADATAELADLYIIQNAQQGNVEAARDYVDTAVNNRYRSIEIELAQRKSAIEELLPTLEGEQRERAQKLQIALGERERNLASEKEDAKLLQNVKLDAIRMAQLNGAPASIVDAINRASTPEEVLSTGGRYASVDMLERAIKSEQLASLRTKKEALRPTSVIDQAGRKMLIDTQTGQVIRDFGVTSQDAGELQLLVNEQAVKQVDDLRSHKGLNSSVGPTVLGRIAIGDIFGAKDDFIAGVDNLTKDLTLDNLIQAKEQGATFGALSNAELQLLAESATKINNWRFGERGPDGSVIETDGYDASQKDFLAELDRIAYFRALDAYKKGSTAQNIGLVETPDGKTWFKNSDGSVTEIK